jgi:hypothetical protein
MTAPTITPLPTPPSRQEPDTFADRSDAFVGALPAFQSEANTLGTFVNDSAVATAADVVLTNADVVTTGNDVVSTGDDVTAAAAQVALAADEVALAADEVALATTQAGNAATSASTALGYLDAFEDSYIGQYADDAAADASGKTIVDGVFYFKTTATVGLRIYNSGWSTAVLDAAGALMAVNNLSDLESPTTAKATLGLETLTQAEAEAGTKTTGAMNPLRTAQAIAALVSFASQAEAQVGTNNTKSMSPLRTAEAIAAQALLKPLFDKSLFKGN